MCVLGGCGWLSGWVVVWGGWLLCRACVTHTHVSKRLEINLNIHLKTEWRISYHINKIRMFHSKYPLSTENPFLYFLN